MKVTVIAIVTGALGTVPKGKVKFLEQVRMEVRAVIIQTNIVNIALNTEKSPADPKRLTMTQNPGKPTTSIRMKKITRNNSLIIIIIIPHLRNP